MKIGSPAAEFGLLMSFEMTFHDLGLHCIYRFAGDIVGACPPVATRAPPKGRRGRPAICYKTVPNSLSIVTRRSWIMIGFLSHTDDQFVALSDLSS
jgi:hypothetical protein